MKTHFINPFILLLEKPVFPVSILIRFLSIRTYIKKV